VCHSICLPDVFRHGEQVIATDRCRVGYIEGARRRPAEFAKRLGNFVRMTAQNRRFGFGGIEKHYDRD
jgi:hypothetical protein